LDDCLTNWQQWPLNLKAPPKFISHLVGGLTNRSALIEIDGQRFVCRRNAPNGKSLGIDRFAEKKILHEVANAGIAPKILLCDPEQGVLISEFIAAEPCSKEALLDPSFLEKFSDYLNKIHSLKLDLPSRNYGEYIQAYWDNAEQRGLALKDKLYQERENLLGTLAKLNESKNESKISPVLCHHDLLPSNVLHLASGRLVFIDWEYAAMGWPAFDWAVVHCEWANKGLAKGLVMANAKGDAAEQELALAVYRHICELWAILQA